MTRIRQRLQRATSRRVSLRTRIVAATALVGLLVVGAVTAISLAVLTKSSATAMDGTLRDRAATLQTRITATGNRVLVTDTNDALFDSTSWVFDARGRVVDGAGITTAGSLHRLGRVTATTFLDGGALRFRADPVRRGGRIVAVIVVAIDRTAYGTSLKEAGVVSLAFGAFMVTALTIAAAVVTGRALRPVGVMARTAQAWSRDRLSARFALGPPRDELTELGGVLDNLLARVETVIAAEERLTAELAHELRTPLTVIAGEAELGLMYGGDGGRFERIRVAADRMDTAMKTLLDAARASLETDIHTDVRTVLAATVACAVSRDGIAIQADPAAFGTVSAPAALLERMVHPVLDNAIRHADSVVDVSAVVEDDTVRITVANDGAAIPAQEIGQVFEPGTRGQNSTGTGLGLALTARLARAAGGRIELTSAAPVEFTLVLPAAP